MKRINLALQGGGAHGAFTWGVLDRLLDEPELEIAAISGTSAGALNGAAVKAGLVAGDRALAKANLDWLWERMGAQTDPRLAVWMAAFGPNPGLVAQMIEYSPFFAGAATASRMFSANVYGPVFQNALLGLF